MGLTGRGSAIRVSGGAGKRLYEAVSFLLVNETVVGSISEDDRPRDLQLGRWHIDAEGVVGKVRCRSLNALLPRVRRHRAEGVEDGGGPRKSRP